MKTQHIHTTALIIIIALVIIGFISIKNNPAAEEGIRIGLLMPLSGDAALFGERIQRGVELALDNFPNAPVSIIYEDTAGIHNQGAVTAFQKLISVDKVNLIIGPFGPEQTLAIAPLIQEGSDVKIFAISLCDERFEEYETVYCTFPSTRDSVASALSTIQELGIESVHLITEKTQYGLNLKQYLEEFGEKYGFELSGVESITRTTNATRDFRTEITKALNSEADTIVSGLLPAEGHVLIKQLHDADYDGIHFALLDTTEDELSKYGDAAEGVYFPGHFFKSYEENFTKGYLEKYSLEPDLYGALGHSIAVTLLESLEVNNWHTEGLHQTITNLQSDAVAINEFTFNDDRTISIPQTILQFGEGKLIETKNKETRRKNLTIEK